MKALLLSLVVLVPTLALAAKIPDPKPGTTICYEGTNKAGKIDKRIGNVKVTLVRYVQYPDTLYSSIIVVTPKGKKYDNGGSVTGDKTASKIDVRMDCDGGGYTLTQDSLDLNKVKLQIESLSLIPANRDCGGIEIDNKNVGESITLTRNMNCKHVDPTL